MNRIGGLVFLTVFVALLSVTACKKKPVSPTLVQTPTPTPTNTFSPTVTATPHGETIFAMFAGGDYNPADPNTDTPVTINYLNQSGVTQTQPVTLLCSHFYGTNFVHALNTPLHGDYYFQVIFPGSNNWCSYYGSSPNWYGVNDVSINQYAVYGDLNSILSTCSHTVTFWESTGWWYYYPGCVNCTPSAIPVTVTCSGTLP